MDEKGDDDDDDDLALDAGESSFTRTGCDVDLTVIDVEGGSP